MDIRKLIYFVEVVNEKSFSRAAKKLYISQPMLSKTVRELEEKFQEKFIERNSKTFQLTDVGKIVYQQSLKVLKEYQELEHLLENPRDRVSGSFALSMPSILMKLFFIPLIMDIRDKYPEMRIELYENGSYKVLEDILAEIVDIGVVMLPVPTDDIEIYPIIYSKCVLVTSKEHPLAKESCVDFTQLQNEKFIMYNRQFVVYDMVHQACFSRGFSPNIIFQSSRSSFLFDMVRNNCGVTIIPEPIFTNDLEGLQKINITPEIPWTLALITKKDRYMSPAATLAFFSFLNHFRANDSFDIDL